MPDETPQPVTPETLHEEVGSLREEAVGMRGEMRAGFADLKTTLITGFGGLATGESNEKMVRLLRENNRSRKKDSAKST